MSRDATGIWTGYAIRRVTCPVCGVAPGTKCDLDKGESNYIENGTHFERVEADDQGIPEEDLAPESGAWLATMTVTCPVCGAEPQTDCDLSKGRDEVVDDTHRKRIELEKVMIGVPRDRADLLNQKAAKVVEDERGSPASPAEEQLIALRKLLDKRVWDIAGRLGAAETSASERRDLAAAVLSAVVELFKEVPWGEAPSDDKDSNYGRMCGLCMTPVRAGRRYTHSCEAMKKREQA